MVQHNRSLTACAQELRKNATKQEKRLWYNFLSRYPLRFRRQVTMGAYIVDFYCAEAKLVVELDGSQHYEKEHIEYDLRRTRALNDMGLRVLRFSNADINVHFREVCEMIDRIAQMRRPLPALRATLPKGEGT